MRAFSLEPFLLYVEPYFRDAVSPQKNNNNNNNSSSNFKPQKQAPCQQPGAPAALSTTRGISPAASAAVAASGASLLTEEDRLHLLADAFEALFGMCTRSPRCNDGLYWSIIIICYGLLLVLY